MDIHELKLKLEERLNISRHNLSRYCRVKEVNQLLDGKTALNLNEQEFNILSSAIFNNVDQFPPYKNFKFNIIRITN
jgi:hypothetical protein